MTIEYKKKPILPRIPLSEVMPTNPANKKCGPDLEFENGSCFPLNLLVDMAEAYNKYSKEKNKKDIIELDETFETTDPDNYKIYLLNEFKKRFDGDQKDWIRHKYIDFLNDETKHYLKNDIFRPDGPQGKFEWLSTLDINKVLGQYENKYENFKFLGAVPIDFDDLDYLPFKKMDFDELKSLGIKKIGVIFNLDEHYKSGSHWVSLFADLNKGQVYFSDSYATQPEKRIRDFMNKIKDYLIKNNIVKPDIRYNKTQHQKGNSECGVYSINFILRLLKGKSFEHITSKRLTDDQVNKCRNIYFGNKIQ
jgi:hypothetical protein